MLATRISKKEKAEMITKKKLAKFSWGGGGGVGAKEVIK
jgi:hypothetical protein